MTLALWCVLLAALMPIVVTGIAKTAGPRYNNRDPRQWQDKQEGLARRADNAHKNSFEAFPFFAVAVLVAHLLAAPQERVDALAVIFIVARVTYVGCYLADWHWARSVAWLVGFVACITLFVLGAG